MLKATSCWLALMPIDLRCGIDRLLVLVQALRGGAAIDDGAYVFRNRAGSRLKVVSRQVSMLASPTSPDLLAILAQECGLKRGGGKRIGFI